MPLIIILVGSQIQTVYFISCLLVKQEGLQKKYILECGCSILEMLCSVYNKYSIIAITVKASNTILSMLPIPITAAIHSTSASKQYSKDERSSMRKINI